jgi:hypothetical protein
MLYLVLLCSWLLGYSLLQVLAKNITLIEKVGLSFLVGMGVHPVVFFIFTLIHVPINQISVVLYTITAILVLNLKAIKAKSIAFNPIEKDKIQFTFAWFFFVGMILYLVYGIAAKGLFWPVAEYDSVTGYDLMGKMIAREGTLHVAFFDSARKTTYDIARFIYPPLTASFFGLGYLFDDQNPSKLIMICLFFSFLLSFYALIRKTIQDTWAMAITFFMMITPEMFSHASLGLTNLPNAIYTSISMVCLMVWLSENNKSYYFLSLLFMALSVFSRSDSVVFVVAIGIVFVIHFILRKEWKESVIYLAIVSIPFVAWTLFVKLIIGANASDFFVPYLFWDAQKFGTIYGKGLELMFADGQLYGITFYAFIVVLALNIFEVVVTKNYLIIAIISSWFLYTFLYYQMDYGFAGSLDAYMNASYKRGIFNFVPLVWFFVGTNQKSLQFFKFVENWLYKNK